MSSITLTASVRQNLLSLQSTAALLATTNSRLATGKKVNTALDNPTSYFTATALNNRASDLGGLLDSIGNGIQVIAAANKGLTAISTTLQSMQAVLSQARQAQTYQAASYAIGTIDTSSVKNLSLSSSAIGAAPVSIALDSAGTTGSSTTTSSSAGAQFSAITGLNPGSPLSASSGVFSDATIVSGQQASFTMSDADVAAMAPGTRIFIQSGNGRPTAYDRVDSGSTDVFSGLFTTGADLAVSMADPDIGLNSPFAGYGAGAFTVTRSGGVTTVTRNDLTHNFKLTGFTPTTINGTSDPLTVSDGTRTATFYKVPSGANSGLGTYTTLDDLVTAINGSVAGFGGYGGVFAVNTGSGDAGTLQLLTGSGGLTVGGAAAAELGLAVTPAVPAGTGAGFTIAVNGGGAHAISVSPTDVTGGSDPSNGGTNSVNLTAAINAKLVAAGIANVVAVKGGTVGVSAATDTITLQATTPGPGTTFSLSGVTGGVIGASVTAGVAGIATAAAVTASADYVAPTALSGPVVATGGNWLALGTPNGNETYSFTVSKNGGAGVSIQLTTADGVGFAIGGWQAIAAINGDLAAGGSTIRIRGNGNPMILGEFYDTDAANTGSAATIDVSDVTTGGTAPSGHFGWEGGTLHAQGTDAANRVVTIGDGTTTATATLTTANAATAAAARTAIQAAIDATALVGKITVGGSANRINLAGKADGSNSITVGGANVADVFGAGRTVTPGSPGALASPGTVKTVDQLVAAINGTGGLIGKVVAANIGGQLSIRNLSASALTLTGVSGSSITGGSGTASVAGTVVGHSYAALYADFQNQLDMFAADSSFNGVNLLNGDPLEIMFNEKGTSRINILGVKCNSQYLGIAPALDAPNVSVDGQLDVLGAALNTVRSLASTFGSNLSVVQMRQDFTKSMVNTLQTGAANLELADINEEGANSQALQTRQQLSVSSLSLANQGTQAVLRLLV